MKGRDIPMRTPWAALAGISQNGPKQSNVRSKELMIDHKRKREWEFLLEGLLGPYLKETKDHIRPIRLE